MTNKEISKRIITLSAYQNFLRTKELHSELSKQEVDEVIKKHSEIIDKSWKDYEKTKEGEI